MGDRLSRIGRLIAAARQRVVLVAAVFVGLFLLIMAVNSFSPARGLQGSFYANESWEGAPVSSVLDSHVHFNTKNTKNKAAEKTRNNEHVSIIWEGYIFAPKDSTYVFSVTSDDGSGVFIDDSLVVDNGGVHPKRLAEKDIFLARGNHRLLIKYFNARGEGSLDFHWRETKTPRIFMPRLFFYPKPVSLSVVILDTALSDLIFLLKAAFLLAGLLLLIIAGFAAIFLFSRCFVFLKRNIFSADERGASAPVKNDPVATRTVVFLLFILIVFLAGYAQILHKNLCPVAGGADSSGYLNAAKMLSKEELIEPLKPLELFSLGPEFSPLFRPLGFSWGVQSGTRVPDYPLGMPLHMAISARLLGWETGPFLVSPAAALLAVLLMILLARTFGLPLSYSIAGGIILAAFPAWLFIAIQPMSDVLATFWVLAAVLAGVGARKRIGWAAASGAAFGISVLVRPSNALMVLPLIFALPFRPKAWLTFAAGYLPFGAFHLSLNHALYGGWLTTGYRDAVMKDFAPGNFFPRFGHYIRWLAVMLTPLVPLAMLGLFWMRRISRKDKMLIITWFLSYFLFYCFYKPHETWWYLRFLLPGIPALILAALLFVRKGHEVVERKVASRKTGRVRYLNKPIVWTAAGLIFLAIFGTEARQVIKLKALDFFKGESVYRESCLRMREEWPLKSVILASQTSGALTFYTDFIICRWDNMKPAQLAVLKQRAESKGYQFRAMLFIYEEQEFKNRVPGRWVKTGNVRDVSLWRLLPDQLP